MLKSLIFRFVPPKNIRLKMSSDTKRRRTTKTSNKSAENESNKENELSPYFNTNKRKMNQDGSEKKSGLKSSSSEVNEKRKPAEKMSSKIAEIDDEPEKSPSELKKIKWQPENWLEQLNRIKTMRSQWDAPVDTMGCDSNFDANSPPNIQRLNILISLMLSSQTKDEITAKAMIELKKLPLEIDAILAADQEKIAQIIYPVSFYKRKAEYIQKTCKILKEQYNSDIPDTVEALCKLPGVGPKMAYLAMSCAWHKTVGIGVDTHVHRISNRLGWIRKAPTKTPEQTRKELEDWLPQCHWDEVNHLLVGFGQTICRPVGPKCSSCLCNDICPTGKKEVKQSNKTTKKIELTD